MMTRRDALESLGFSVIQRGAPYMDWLVDSPTGESEQFDDEHTAMIAASEWVERLMVDWDWFRFGDKLEAAFYALETVRFWAAWRRWGTKGGFDNDKR